jgi:hypothetical protein
MRKARKCSAPRQQPFSGNGWREGMLHHEMSHQGAN